MRTIRFAAICLLIVGASAFGWRATRTRVDRPASTLSAQPPPAQPLSQHAQTRVPSAAASARESASHLGPFSIAGGNYTVELQTKKVGPVPTNEQYDTVIAVEIRDATWGVEYQRMFPYVEAKEDYFESWAVCAHLLNGTNGTGVLVSYDTYTEPSAPEEEPTGWFQVFGVMNGKFVPFGAPLEVQGDLLDKYADCDTYRTARSLGAQADAVEFKVWTGHCRLIYPVRVDWVQGKLTPAQECTKTTGEFGAGCQYNVVPEDKFYSQGITFVRLWPNPDEKSGQPVKTVVKKDSKVDLLIAMVATQWVEDNPMSSSVNTKDFLKDAGGFGVASDSDLWLKVRIDGREGWMHSEEDFLALGLPANQ